MECLRLRIKDVDFSSGEIRVSFHDWLLLDWLSYGILRVLRDLGN